MSWSPLPHYCLSTCNLFVSLRLPTSPNWPTLFTATQGLLVLFSSIPNPTASLEILHPGLTVDQPRHLWEFLSSWDFMSVTSPRAWQGLGHELEPGSFFLLLSYFMPRSHDPCTLACKGPQSLGPCPPSVHSPPGHSSAMLLSCCR